MNILNIGTDKTLVGGKVLGDAIERHRRYGQYLDHLDIIVYSNKKEGLKKFEISDKVTGYPTNSRSKLRFFFDARKIFKKINQDHKIDIIVCQDPFIPGLIGACLKKKYKAKLQINFHGDFWENSSWLKERWINIIFLLISKITVPRADAIRVMSQGQKDKLGKYKNKARVISTPVDLEKYLNYKPSIPGKCNPKIVLHVGRDDEAKDYDTLVKSYEIIYNHFNKGNDIKVVLYQIGADKKLRESVAKIRETCLAIGHVKLNIEIMGQKEQNFLIGKYYDSDVVVLSSTSESFGKVLVEANACGKPVVSTATTGAKEIIQDGVNGFLVPIGDAQALAEKIIYLLDNPEEAKEMGKRGRELVKKKYGDNTERIINLWKELYDKKS